MRTVATAASRIQTLQLNACLFVATAFACVPQNLARTQGVASVKV
jgi:hypothetical protein